jgi:MFS family permease
MQNETVHGSPDSPTPFWEFSIAWKVLLAAAFGTGCGVTGVAVYSLTLFITPLSEAFGWSRAEVSAAKTFMTLGFVVTAPFIGYLADSIGVRRIGILSLITLSMAMFCMTQIDGDIRIFYLGLFLTAVAGCGTTPLVWTRAVATWFREKRGLAFALTLTGSGVAGVISPMIIGTLIDQYGWPFGYVGMGIIALFALLPVSLFFFERPKTSVDDAQTAKRKADADSGLDLRDALMSRHFWQIALGFAIIGGIVSALIVHLVPLLTGAGMERTVATRISSLLAAAVIFGRLLTGYLVDKFHPPYIAGMFLIAPVIGMGILSGDPVLLAIILAAITFGFAAGSEVDLIPYLTSRYFGLKSYGRIYGSIFVFFYLGVGLGPPLFGYMYDLNGDYSRALIIAIPLLAGAVIAITLLGRPPEIRPANLQAMPQQS